MAVLYLTDQGATVHKQGGSIVVRKLGRRLHSIHAFNLEQVVVFGRVHLTPQLIHFLLEENIDTVFMSTAGRFRGRLVSGEGRNIELRRAQFRRGEDPAFELDLARRFVRGKLQNSRALVRRHQRTGP
ncbi:MAG TPA: CRISPR-associated endonuclease Cas1, partial [Candidatus Nitrosotenuis sp.]|nr:CRISPR-associated endonuclease Cas1 [Candidatus Nitrosotenuis sp.]